MKVVFDLEKGGKAVTYVYYTIYFIYWNPSFKRRGDKTYWSTDGLRYTGSNQKVYR